MKQYDKHILQYGQQGHSGLERNPVHRHVYTEEDTQLKDKKIADASPLLLFPTWFSFYSRCYNIRTLFKNRNAEL